ncbi:hypothetical protein FQN50_003717 [Emmonsiellopsis sp. PD_5]|nr:hypothetical protein FQN50_003717 [Emmonsiellopsis sp. PD_5]
MGCSSSSQAREDAVDERVVVKSLDNYQISEPSSTSTLLPDFKSNPLEQTTQQPDTTTNTDTALKEEQEHAFAEEIREFEDALMEITLEPFPDYTTADVTPAPEPAAEPQPEPEPEQLECNFCCQQETGDGFLLRPCKKCSGLLCKDCIRKMFISASVDEASMPPRCCGPLNIGVAVSVLTPEEVQRFKDKHEEWSTANRVYCPVPTCSIFIPYRLFPAEFRPGAVKQVKKEVKGEREPTVTFGPTQMQTPPPTPPASTPTPHPEHVAISCPGCTVEICCSCKQLAHRGASCPEGAGELPSELAELLEKWNIKRCPKCRAAVRRMYGCSHIACRCGDQWCWHCLQPIQICRDEGCFVPTDDDEDDDDYDSDDDNDETQNRDLDRGGRNRWEEDYNIDFGEEPVLEKYDPFDCSHQWEEYYDSWEDPRDYNHMCERCWRVTTPALAVYPEVAELMEHGFIVEKPGSDNGMGHTDLRTVMCVRCKLMICDGCQRAEKVEKGVKMEAERLEREAERLENEAERLERVRIFETELIASGGYSFWHS